MSKEQARVDAIQARLDDLISLQVIDQDADSSAIQEYLDRVKGTAIDESFAEFANQAAIEKEKALAYLQKRFDAAIKREQDKAHRTKINNLAVDSLTALGFSKTDGKKIITAIAKGQVFNVSIKY